MLEIWEQLAQELGQPEKYVKNVIDLIDEGNTIPFIARYRKEMHGSMDDTTLRTLEDRLKYLRGLAERKEEVKKSIAAQEKLTDELSVAIDAAKTLAEVEDLYRPYKQKRRTRASIAKEKGLEPLSDFIYAQTADTDRIYAEAEKYVFSDKGVENVKAALDGASDIIAESVSDSADIRKEIKEIFRKSSLVVSAGAKEEDSVYRNYYN